jgi:cell division protein FtsW
MIPDRLLDDETPAAPPPPPEEAPLVETPERPLDLWLLAAVLALLVIGTVQIFSSSAVYALDKHGDSAYFFKRQLVWMALGLPALWFGATHDYRWLRRWTYPLLTMSVVLLAAVLFLGAHINGARRWFMLGPLSFQPVEIAKLTLVTYLAYSLSKKAEKVKSFTVGFVPHLVVCGGMMVLLMKQPDLGSSIILGTTTLTLLFIAGTKISYILLALLAAAPLAYQVVVGTTWRMQRFMAFLNPDAYSDGVNYQIKQAQIAVGSGGATGQGLGEGKQQLGYMIEGHSDFIMASVGEEMGFIGFGLVLALFAVIVWRGARAALNARDPFGTYLALGIAVTMGVQAVVNTGVVLGMLPAKGLTLPFVSYGGSSLVVTMFAAGVLLNIARARPRPALARALVQQVGARRKRERVVIVCDS